MKIAQSIRAIYDENLQRYQIAKEVIESRIRAKIDSGWHFIGRIKTLESFAQKMETGRFDESNISHDLFACTIVVERTARVQDAEEIVMDIFQLVERKPKNANETYLRPSCFDFDEVRLYLQIKEDERLPPTGVEGLIFEVQIKTFLQHAWGLATHDLIYKADRVDWMASRIAYQVKAMLEHAEASIASVPALSNAQEATKSDSETRLKHDIIIWLRKTWEHDKLPMNVVRLAECVIDLMKVVDLDQTELHELVDQATKRGQGSLTLNISPFGAIMAAVLDSPESIKTLERIAKSKRRTKKQLFIPAEIGFPKQDEAVEALLCRTVS